MSNIDKVIEVMKKGYYLRLDKDSIDLISLTKIEIKKGDVFDREEFISYDLDNIGITHKQLYNMRYSLIKRAEKEKLTFHFYLANRGIPRKILLIIKGVVYFEQKGYRLYVDKLREFELEFNRDNFFTLFSETKIREKYGEAYNYFLAFAPFFNRQLELSKEVV